MKQRPCEADTLSQEHKTMSKSDKETREEILADIAALDKEIYRVMQEILNHPHAPKGLDSKIKKTTKSNA